MTEQKRPPKKKASTSKETSTNPSSTKPKKSLPVLPSDPPRDPLAGVSVDETALSARWPEAVLALSDDERKARVRQGLDSVLLDDVQPDGRRITRGFVRAVLRVPLSSPKARVYGVFIEVDRDGYVALQKAFASKAPTRVTGKLATRLPFLDEAYGSAVVVEEDGSDKRARVVDVDSAALRDGPAVGPRLAKRAQGQRT